MEEQSFGTCNAIENHDVENIDIENLKTENRKMKNVILISVITLIIGLALFISDAVAEQRMITFEMGESGQTVSFPMSPEEIIFADSVVAYGKSLKTAGRTTRKKWVDRIELPETGQYLEFPMTDEEIRAEI